MDENKQTPMMVDTGNPDLQEPQSSLGTTPIEIPEASQYLIDVIKGNKPVDLTKIEEAKKDLETRFNMAITEVTTQNLATVIGLQQKLMYLFNAELTEESVLLMEPKDRLKMISTVSKTINDTLEFTRKLTVQNRELFKTNTEADEVSEMLKELPQGTLRRVKEAIEKGEF